VPRRARMTLPMFRCTSSNAEITVKRVYADEDYRFYLDWLREHSDKTGCRVHAYGHNMGSDTIIGGE